MAKRVNLYLCAEPSPMPTNFRETDGVNLYRHEIHRYEDRHLMHFYKHRVNDCWVNELMFSVVIWNWDPAVRMRVCYSIVDGKTYVTILNEYSRPGRMILIRDGEIVDDIRMTIGKSNFAVAYGYKTVTGHFSNIIGRVRYEDVAGEYFIDPILDKIRLRLYRFNNLVWSHTSIISTATHMSHIRSTFIETIYRNKLDACHLSTAIAEHKELSLDGKYIYVTGDNTLIIYNSSTLQRITDVRLYNDSSARRLFGDIDGIMIFYSDRLLSISFFADKYGQLLDIVDGESYGDLYFTSFGKIKSSTAALYQFTWDWRFYRLQRPEIKRLAMCIFMTLTLHCGIVKHVAKIIGEIAMSP